MSLEANLLSGEADRPFVGSRVALFSLRMVFSAVSTLLARCLPLPSSFVFVPGVMRINIPQNKRHFVVAEEMRDRCVVTSAAAATCQNVDVVDVQLMAIGHRNRNALLLQMRIGLLWKSGHVVDEGDRVFDFD